MDEKLMRCPTLSELPPPPAGKTGWPWTEESPPLPDRMPDGSPWPRISIVTPSYNQGQFIEETIRSVLLQGYPDLEYIVMDGGSTDDSVEIIKKYEPWLAYWVSERDKGQAYAINMGFKRATGVIVAWLNSDDVYYQTTLQYVGQKYSVKNPDFFWLVLGVDYVNYKTGETVTAFQGEWYTLGEWLYGNANPNQQGSFWAYNLFDKFGFLLEEMHYGFDKEYFMRLIANGVLFHRCEQKVSGYYRLHSDCKFIANRIGFIYDWSRIKILYAGSDDQIKRSAKKDMAYALIRMSQSSKLSRSTRLLKLVEAVWLKPLVVIQRDFLGSIKAAFKVCD